MDSAPLLPPSWMTSWGFAPAAASSGRPRHGRAWRRSTTAGLVPEKTGQAERCHTCCLAFPLALSIFARSPSFLVSVTAFPLPRQPSAPARPPPPLLLLPFTIPSCPASPRSGPPAPAQLRPASPRSAPAASPSVCSCSLALPSAPARWLFRLLLLVGSSACSCSLALPSTPARLPPPRSPRSIPPAFISPLLTAFALLLLAVFPSPFIPLPRARSASPLCLLSSPRGSSSFPPVLLVVLVRPSSLVLPLGSWLISQTRGGSASCPPRGSRSRPFRP